MCLNKLLQTNEASSAFISYSRGSADPVCLPVLQDKKEIPPCFKQRIGRKRPSMGGEATVDYAAALVSQNWLWRQQGEHLLGYSAAR